MLNIVEFVDKYASKVIKLELEFGVIYTTLGVLTDAILSEEISDALEKKLAYCINSLVFRTMDDFPECSAHLMAYKFDISEYTDDEYTDHEDD